MLTEINLDDEGFEELEEQAKNLIISYAPQWTDFNYHDPGITISELFVWMKEIAQYRMNYVGEAHHIKYLKLMGLSRHQMQPAHVRVRVDCPQTMELPIFTRFFASGICFESIKSQYLLAHDIAGCIYLTGGREIFLNRDLLRLTKSLKIPPFGRTPLQGERFYILLDEPLPQGQALSLFVEINDQYPIRRNPIRQGDRFTSITKLSMGYHTAEGWKFCDTFCDGTYGFLQSGWMEFVVKHPMQKMSMAGQDAYFLCIELQDAQYDVCPILTDVGFNRVETKQMRHYAVCYDKTCEVQDGRAFCRLEANEITVGNVTVLVPWQNGYRMQQDCTVTRKEKWLEFHIGPGPDGILPNYVRILAWELLFGIDQVLGEGTGLPNQQYSLPERNILPQEFQLMIEEPGQAELLREWKQVDDFSCSGVEDRHYLLDEQHRMVRFGDCIHGMAPEGRIFIAQYVTSEGSRGNVKAGRIDSIEEGYEQLTPLNEDDATGGRDLESVEECFLRAKRALYQNEGLVTDADYEQAVRTTPGLMIESCKVLHTNTNIQTKSEKNSISIVVKPFSQKKNPNLSLEYSKNIYMWLEKRRMIGTEIRLLSPIYLQLYVYVKYQGRNGNLSGRKSVRQLLEQYFEPFASQFGGVLSPHMLYEQLDRLDAVTCVDALTLDVMGYRVKRTRSGELLLPPNGLLSLEEIQYHIRMD